MGEVYRAHDTKLGRDVAIKVLPDAFAHDAERVARFEREARLLASLNHPRIATIHGLEEADGRKFLVMELVEGPTLAEWIPSRMAGAPAAAATSESVSRGAAARGRGAPRAFSIDEALTIMRQISEGLEAAHDKGVIHRDLKPANVKVTPDGQVKILDFGLAKAFAPVTGSGVLSQSPTITDAAMTRPGVVLGTAAYMSPEQARGHEVDQRSDIWAFGCIVYEILTGRTVFAGATISDTIAAVLEREPDWTRLPPDVPLGIRRLLRRCLEKDPRRRLHAIADARLEIDDAGGEPDETLYTAQSAAPRRREWILGLAAAVLAIGLAISLAAFALRAPVSAPAMRVEISTPGTLEPTDFEVSPDGLQLVFVGERDGQSILWVRPLAATSAQGVREVQGTEGASRPFWSPDSRHVGFFARGELRTIDVRGGPPQTLVTAVGGSAGAWGEDGTILYSFAASQGGLFRIANTGDTPVQATILGEGQNAHYQPQFLPGGREFLLYASGSEDAEGLYVGSLDSLDVTRLLAADTKGIYLPSGWLLFIRQGTLLAQRLDPARRMVSGEPVVVADSVASDSIFGTGSFSASVTGVLAFRTAESATTQLTWFDRSGSTLGTLGPSDHTGLVNIDLSPDGLQVAVERTAEDAHIDIWIIDAASGRETRMTDAPGATRFPVWSGDGSRVAFAQSGTGSSWTFLEKLSNGGGAERVLWEAQETMVPTDWSPDDRFLLYYVPTQETGADLRVLPLEGDPHPFDLPRTRFSEVAGQFSPNGRWVAYHSNLAERFEVYVEPFPPRPGGRRVTVSTSGGVYPRWARDGTELYYIAPDRTLMATPVSASLEEFEAGTPVALFRTRKVGGGQNVVAHSPQYDVAPDGRFLINAVAESAVPPITLLLNWQPPEE